MSFKGEKEESSNNKLDTEPARSTRDVAASNNGGPSKKVVAFLESVDQFSGSGALEMQPRDHYRHSTGNNGSGIRRIGEQELSDTTEEGSQAADGGIMEETRTLIMDENCSTSSKRAVIIQTTSTASGDTETVNMIAAVSENGNHAATTLAGSNNTVTSNHNGIQQKQFPLLDNHRETVFDIESLVVPSPSPSLQSVTAGLNPASAGPKLKSNTSNNNSSNYSPKKRSMVDEMLGKFVLLSQFFFFWFQTSNFKL